MTDLFAVGGEMGELIRAKDWSQTPLGPIETWPQSLKSAVSILLPSKAQIALFWGAELTTLYNDAYSLILADKHSRVLGTPASYCWSDIWEGQLDGLFQRVLDTGEAFWGEDVLFLMQRRGFLEETYFNISYDPVRDESGGVGGIFAIVSETTRRVLGQRRLKTQRLLAERANQAKSVEDACRIAVETLQENQADVPFALVYLLENDQPLLVSSMGIDHPASVKWDFAEVKASGKPVMVNPLDGHFPGIWPEPPHTALILPFPGQQGFLVVGVSPRLALDDDYRAFFELVAGHIGSAISNARAYEEERKRAEALAELDRAKVEFFSNVSHEFRTPLTLILNPLRELLETNITSEQRETLTLMHRNSLRLLKLVNTLLDFSRIQSNRIQAVYEPTDLARLTADLASSFRSAVEQAGIKLIVDCAPLPQPVSIDRDMWEKIVLNLLSNAFKFTFDGEISISLTGDERDVYLTVRDSGIGISEDQLPLIFDRFHRVQGAKARTYEGSGIGLALVKELVEFLNGNIRVVSEPDKGTTFTVTIPARVSSTAKTIRDTDSIAAAYIEEAMSWVTDEPVYHNGSSTDEYVLIVDDNADMRDYLRRLLEHTYDVQTAKNGQDALDLIGKRQPDLLLVDVMMPEMDGFELLRRLRAHPETQSLPVVLLSARAGEESRVEGLKMGADDYLAKPFSARELLARVEANLQIARLRRESETRLRDVLENMPVMMFATDGEKRILAWNREAERITGYLAEEVIDHPNAPTLLYPDPVYREQLAEFHRHHRGDYRNWQVSITCKDGSKREVLWSNVSKAFPVPGWASWIMGVDITERVQSEQRVYSLQQITAALSEALTPSQVADVIIQKALDTLRCHHGTVGLVTGNQLELVQSAGIPNEIFEKNRYTPIDAIAPLTDIVRNGEPVWVESQEQYVNRYPNYASIITKITKTHSAALLPMIVNGRTIGGLILSFPFPQKISEETKNFLTTLAHHCAQALERARLYQAEQIARNNAEQTVDQLYQLQQVTAALLMASTPDEVIKVIVEQGIVTLGGVAGSVVSVTNGELRVIASNGYAAEFIKQWQIVPENTPLAAAIREKKPIWIRSRAEMEAIFPPIEGKPRTSGDGSWAAVPLIIEDRTVGAIGLTFPTPRPFSEPERTFILTLAQQAAQALERSRAYEAEKSARAAAESTADRIARLQTMTSALSEALTPNEVAMIVMEQGMALIGAYRGGVFIMNPDGQSYEMLGATNFSDDINQQFQYLSLQDPVPMSDTLRTGKAIWILNLEEYRTQYPHLADQVQPHTQTHALACIPMMVDGRIIGGVGASFSESQPFNEVDRLFIISIAQQAAQALERARAYQAEKLARSAAESTAERINRLQKITSSLSEALTPTEVAKVILNQGLSMMESITGVVATLSGDKLEILAERGHPVDVYERYKSTTLNEAIPLTEVFKTGQPIWIPTLEMYRERYPELASFAQPKTGAKALFCVPMNVNGRIIGAVGASFAEPQTFGDVDRWFILSIAQQCAQALERARAYQAEKIARQEAQEANNQKLKFLGMISHELRTPLTSIKGFATTLLAQDVQFDKETEQYFLHIIDQESDKLTVLVDQLLDLARLQAGTLAIFPDIHPVQSVIEVATAQLVMVTVNHQLSVGVPAELPNVYADVQRIAQVLVNLVGNAAKFAPVGSKISVSAALDGQFVRIDVSDEGPGIAPEQQDIIFEAFRQVESQSQRQNKGAGLGLAICRGIIDSHGGQIWVQKGIQTGTTISFTLPVV